MLVLIAILALTTFSLVFYAIYEKLTAAKRLTEDRLDKYVLSRGYSSANIPSETEEKKRTWRTVLRYLSAYVKPPSWDHQIESQLVRAGIPLKGTEFLIISVGVAIAGAILLFILGKGNFIFAVAGAGGGFLLVRFTLNMKIKRRAKAFNDQLGDALVLIANSLRTGFSFMQSMEMVSREMLPPIAGEFARALKEINLGVNTEKALNNMTMRVDSADLDLVVTAVLIQRQVGGNLAEILDNIAFTIRERVRLKGEIRTLTAQGRVSGMVVSLLPVGVGIIIYIINPDYMSILFKHPMGKILIIAAVVSQVIGIWMVNKVVDIDV